MNRQSNNDPSTHFKMYKSGKKWVFAGLTAVTLLTATGAVAHADNASVSSEEPATTANTQNNTNTTNILRRQICGTRINPSFFQAV